MRERWLEGGCGWEKGVSLLGRGFWMEEVQNRAILFIKKC